jgi:nucleoside phosphorylase
VDVGYDHLVTLEKDEGLEHTFRPERADRKYSVSELLEGVRDDPSRRDPSYWMAEAGSVLDIMRRRRYYMAAHAERAFDIVDVVEDEAPAQRPLRRVGSRYSGKVDFGILTIRADENTAVLSRFPKLATEEGRRRYRIRTLALPNGGTYTLAVLRCLEQGNTDSQDAANALLHDLEPRFLLVVGIAGGVPHSEFSLGDVVVSSRIVDFSVETVMRDEKREYALGAGPLHPDAAKLAADVSAMVADGELGEWSSPEAIKLDRPQVDLSDDRFYGPDDWMESARKKLRRHFAGKPRAPLAVTGAIASSDRLMKDAETMSVWSKIARQVVAVEMESAGIYKATQGAKVPFLAIRGISDVIGFKREDEWTPYACETAAAFAQAFLLTQPIAPLR